MSFNTRMKKAFLKAPVLSLSPDSRYVIISDCHRGNGTAYDNFLKNQNPYFAALDHYYKQQFTYIELGDGDELWENRSMSQIIDIHSNVFWLMKRFYRDKRLYLMYGNHDIVKKYPYIKHKHCRKYYCAEKRKQIPLFPDIIFHEGLILKDVKQRVPDVYLTHGHQAELLNSSFWPLARFLVRYLWKPLELIGFLAPTSAAKNTVQKNKTERRLISWANENKKILIAGHTHRPMLSDNMKSPYFNSGSCVHPRCITALEIEGFKISLVKWSVFVRPDRSLSVEREILAEPVWFTDFLDDFSLPG